MKICEHRFVGLSLRSGSALCRLMGSSFMDLFSVLNDRFTGELASETAKES